MKPITNKTRRVDSKNCTFSEIEAGNKSRKVANRRDAKKQIRETLIEDEKIVEEMWNEKVEREIYQEDSYLHLELLEEERLVDQFHPDFRPAQYFLNKD